MFLPRRSIISHAYFFYCAVITIVHVLEVASVVFDNVVTPVTANVPPVIVALFQLLFCHVGQTPDTLPYVVLEVASVVFDNVVTPRIFI